jgi:hypothetical protein
MLEQSARTPSPEEIDEESRRVRRLRITVALALDVIAQGQMPLEEANDLAAATRRAALNLFPGKEAVYDLIYLPKFRRLIRQVYRIQ